jgi:hypothetical protein
MQLPVLTDYQLAALEQMSFGETTAFMLNLFFGTRLTGWDVDFAVGRQAMVLKNIGHSVMVTESWHNPAGKHDYMVSRLFALALGEKYPSIKPSLWFRTVIDIALLFASHAKMCQSGICKFDIAVESADLQMLFALRYAQKMGLPVGGIIMGSVEGDGLWEFISYGDYPTGRKILPSGMEALLWLEFGHEEATKLLKTEERKGIYHLDQTRIDIFRRDMFTSVVGYDRALSVAKSAVNSGLYAMEISTARAFGALQDYRAKTGINRNTLLIARNAPRPSRKK